MAKFPKMKLKDPYAKKGIPTWKKWMYSIIFVGLVGVALWLTNCLAWANLPSPLPYYNQVDEVEVVEISTPASEATSEVLTDSVAS
jgi:hypothetical protein